jgi:hypothetical protein
MGKRFGRWKVAEPLGIREKGLAKWVCRCDCGTLRPVRPIRLRNGESQSCGCLQREIVSGHAPRLTHGLSNTPEYRAWQQMKVRCNNPSHPSWKYYGARGISVCPEWMGSFESFYEYVGAKPSPKHSLGRIDDDGHYESGNVEWQTAAKQAKTKNKPGRKKRSYKAAPPPNEIEEGAEVGFWTVLEPATSKHGPRWWCQCQCGANCAVAESLLRSGRSQSCGCRRTGSGFWWRGEWREG